MGKAGRRISALMAYLCLVATPQLALAESAGATDQTGLELFSLVFGGIGIFLIGIHFAGDHLQKITGGTFQDIIGRISNSHFGAVIGGLMLGFLTQSGKASAFILSDFVQAGMIKARRSASIVFWGNAGSSLIVFASILSIKVFALCLLGATALGITFKVPRRLVQGYGALFGLAMIMFGLYLVKSGATGFASHPSVPAYLEALQGSYAFSFLLGLALTLMVQSNIAIMMIMIAMASAGLFALDECVMAILGAQAGSGILTYIFSFHAKGTARQTVVSQIAFDATATVFLLLLITLEKLTGLPLLLALVTSASANVGTQVMLAALLFQFSGAAVLVALKNPIFDVIEARFPPSDVEVLSQPAFVHRRAGDSAETGLLLVEQEQFRLLNRLPLYFEYVRSDDDRGGKKSPVAFHDAFDQVAAIISSSLSQISAKSLNRVGSDTLIKTTKIEEQLVRLEETVFQMAQNLLRHSADTKAGRLGRNIMESIDFMMLTAIDAIESGDAEEIETLSLLTQDRAALMTKLRHDYFESETDLSQAERSFILDITILFENAVQTLARYGVLLKDRRA